MILDLIGLHDVVILAVKRPGDTHETEVRRVKTARGFLDALGVPHKLAIGAYKGDKEIVIIAAPRDDKLAKQTVSMAFGFFEQESVLLLGNTQKNGQREAALLYDIGCIRRAGMLTEVSPEYAAHCDAWTFCPDTETYYTTL